MRDNRVIDYDSSLVMYRSMKKKNTRFTTNSLFSDKLSEATCNPWSRLQVQYTPQDIV